MSDTEPKEISLHLVKLGEKQVIFPGESVQIKSSENRKRLSELPSPVSTDKAVITIANVELGPSDQFVFAAPSLNEGTGDCGTICHVLFPPNSSSDVILRGICRASVKAHLGNKQVLVSLISDSDVLIDSKMMEKLHNAIISSVKSTGNQNVGLQRALKLTDILMPPHQVIDLVSSSFPFNLNTRYSLFTELDISNRLNLLVEHLELFSDSFKKLKDNSAVVPGKPLKIEQSNPQSNIHPLRLHRSANGGRDDDEIGLLKSKLTELKPYMPEEGQKAVDREIRRVSQMNSQTSEYSMLRNYLETVAEIPWNKQADSHLDRESISRTQKYLDEDNYGLQDVKKRLVEYTAISYLRNVKKQDNALTTAPIMLLVGPPGVGKTSLAKSVARAMNKDMYRISLGGVRDEAEIRGHRRTYVGSMPGALVQALKKAGSMNPVIVLDEIDKISSGSSPVHGDPSAALLEVLDPAQNYSFKDHYIDFPIDLSNVTFIATANSLNTIPRPLLDRMEVIQIEGYTQEEKLHISQKFLIPKQLLACGLDEDYLQFDDEAVLKVISKYTRESGVRELDRQIGAICRGWSVKHLDSILNGKEKPLTPSVVSIDEVKSILGTEIYSSSVVDDDADKIVVDGEVKQRHTAGVVNGLAYMGSGMGGILVLEASMSPNGSGKLKLTGKLGAVMSESANVALSWVKSNATKLGISPTSLTEYDFHLHVPAGAVSKDGPSAGVAITICLISLFTGKPVPRDFALTGEMTLRGKVLPVGGIREKLLGAYTAGVHRILLPYDCKNVVIEETKKGVKFPDLNLFYVKYIWDVLAEIWPDDSLALVGQRSLL